MNDIIIKDNWQLYVLTEEQMKSNWGTLQHAMEANELKGAIAFGVNERGFYRKHWHYNLINLLQRISMSIGIKEHRPEDSYQEKKVKFQYINGQQIELKEEFCKVNIVHSFVLGNHFNPQEKEKVDYMIEQKQKQLAQLKYGCPSIKWLSVWKTKSRLIKEIDRLSHYQLSDNNSLWISEAGESGLRKKVWRLNEDHYSHLMIFVPPSDRNQEIGDLAEAGVVDELLLLDGKKSHKEVPKFNFFQSIFISFIDRRKKEKHKMNSILRAVKDLNKGETIKTKKGQPKAMVCSEFVTRILQTEAITSNLKQQKIDINEKTVKKTLNDKKLKRKSKGKKHSILEYAPAGTAPYALAELLIKKCRRNLKKD